MARRLRAASISTILFIPLIQSEGSNCERIANMIRMLSRRHRIIGIPHTPFFGTTSAMLRRWRFLRRAPRVLWFGWHRRRDIDLIFCVQEYHATIGVILSLVTGKPCIWDTERGVVSFGERRWSFDLVIGFLLQRVVGQFVALAFAPTEGDTLALQRWGHLRQRVFYFPTPVDSTFVEPSGAEVSNLRHELGLGSEVRTILFVGNRRHSPSRDAAFWVNNHLAPAVASACPDVRILIAGRGELPRQIRSNVIFTGYVSDIYALTHLSDVAIAPVWSSMGQPTKVLDYMTCGKATVVTPWAVWGIPRLQDGYNTLVAYDECEFVAKTLELLEDPGKALRIGMAARETVVAAYSWDVWAEKLEQALELALARY